MKNKKRWVNELVHPTASQSAMDGAPERFGWFRMNKQQNRQGIYATEVWTGRGFQAAASVTKRSKMAFEVALES